MRVDEFVASRIAEAVVHGIDLAQAGVAVFRDTGRHRHHCRDPDDLLARRTTGRRPAGLPDDMDWILAASGRAESGDNRLPLIG